MVKLKILTAINTIKRVYYELILVILFKTRRALYNYYYEWKYNQYISWGIPMNCKSR
jgi:hypothetical protein